MNEELEELLKELRAYRDDMVARNYPYQQISDIITKWEMKDVPNAMAPSRKRDFLDEAEREKEELEDSYQEAVRQTKERNDK
jgi:predicted patatin/cPLA2 family phospholipase